MRRREFSVSKLKVWNIFGMDVSGDYGRESLRTMVKAVLKCAIIWTPNLCNLEMMLVSDDDEPFNIMPNISSRELW